MSFRETAFNLFLRFSLGTNQIGDRGLLKISEAVSLNKSLTELLFVYYLLCRGRPLTSPHPRLYDNQFTGVGRSSLAIALAENKSIKEIWFVEFCTFFVGKGLSRQCGRLQTSFDNDLVALKDLGRIAKLGLSKVNRARLYLCGDSTAGKTTLIQSLCFGRVPPHARPCKSTQGISVFTTSLAGKQSWLDRATCRGYIESAQFSIWDFAGQEDYHISHSLFVETELALFLVLCDLRWDCAQVIDRLRYWLQYICTQTARGCKPQVILVGTHLDMVKMNVEKTAELDAIAVKLAAEFDRLEVMTRVVCVNARSSSGAAMAELRVSLSRMQDTLQARSSVSFPTICLEAAKAIEAYRSSHPMERLCSKQHFEHEIVCSMLVSLSGKDEILDSMLRFLHRTGDIYFDPSSSLGTATIVLDIGWLCGSVLGWMLCPLELLDVQAKLKMRELRAQASRGMVAQAAAKSALHSCLGAQLSPDCALGVLADFQLCFCSRDTVLFPALLTSEAPTSIWQQDDRYQHYVGRVYICENQQTLVPMGLFPNLQVAMLEKFRDQYEALQQHDGVALEQLVFRGNIKCFSGTGAQGLASLGADGRSIQIISRSQVGVAEARRFLFECEQLLRQVAQQHAALRLQRYFCSAVQLKQHAAIVQKYKAELVVGKPLSSFLGNDRIGELLGVDQGILSTDSRGVEIF